MKRNIIYVLGLGMGLATLSSCKRELLSPVPQTSVSDATAFDTPARVANQVNSLYFAYKNGNFMGGRGQIAGDIIGEDFLNETTNGITGFDVWQLNALGTSANFIKNQWAQGYYTINLCNLFIEGMSAKGTSVVGATQGAAYVAEARLIRALCYLQLVEHYARPYADGNGSKPGLPLRLTGIKGSGSSALARSTVAEVYNQILADLNYAESNLPASYTAVASNPAPANTAAYLNTTRAHKNTAIAIKTRVYLAMGNYPAVITEGNKLAPQATAPFSATSGVPHALQANVLNVFRSPYTTTESILSMPMTSTSGDNPGTQNQLGFYFAKSTGGGEYSLNPAGIYGNASWTATDARKTNFTAVVAGKPYLNAKYSAGTPFTDYAPIIRYAEVLLNLAEGLARQSAGVDAKAVALLNAVRQRSDPSVTLAPATKTDLINAILLERRIEFLGEGLRNFDLMRLLQTIPAKGSALAKTPTEQGYIWPISADEMSLNPLMTDN